MALIGPSTHLSLATTIKSKSLQTSLVGFRGALPKAVEKQPKDGLADSRNFWSVNPRLRHHQALRSRQGQRWAGQGRLTHGPHNQACLEWHLRAPAPSERAKATLLGQALSASALLAFPSRGCWAAAQGDSENRNLISAQI